MSNIVFKRVTMKNFMSFGNVPTSVQLDNGTTFGIIGDNRDIGSDGSSKNGVGKTSTYSAIIFGLFGKSIDKLKADEFVNITNGNKLVVDVEFSKNGVEYVISRGRKPSFLSFRATIDGEKIILITPTEAFKKLGLNIREGYDIY